MTHVSTTHKIDNLFRDVARVITDTLDRTQNPEDIDENDQASDIGDPRESLDSTESPGEILDDDGLAKLAADISAQSISPS